MRKLLWLLVLLCACGKANPNPTANYRVGKWSVTFPAGAQDYEKAWLRQTTELHWAWYMAPIPTRSHVPEMHLVWVRDANELRQHRLKIEARGEKVHHHPANPPVPGFVHKHYVYVLAGQKLEGQYLIRWAWHYALGVKDHPVGDPRHLDRRWRAWAFDDETLSWLIYNVMGR